MGVRSRGMSMGRVVAQCGLAFVVQIEQTSLIRRSPPSKPLHPENWVIFRQSSVVPRNSQRKSSHNWTKPSGLADSCACKRDTSA